MPIYRLNTKIRWTMLCYVVLNYILVGCPWSNRNTSTRCNIPSDYHFRYHYIRIFAFQRYSHSFPNNQIWILSTFWVSNTEESTSKPLRSHQRVTIFVLEGMNQWERAYERVLECTNQRSFYFAVCQGLLSCRRHIGKREDPGDEVAQDRGWYLPHKVAAH